MKPLTETEVRTRIRAYIDTHHGGNQAAAARAWGYSRGFVCDVLAGRRPPPNGPMLQCINMKRAYVECRKSA